MLCVLRFLACPYTLCGICIPGDCHAAVKGVRSDHAFTYMKVYTWLLTLVM